MRLESLGKSKKKKKTSMSSLGLKPDTLRLVAQRLNRRDREEIHM
jgi:hypothetical protein